MSSNPFPEPPRLSSAKEIMKKLNSVKNVSSERTTEFSLSIGETDTVSKANPENIPPTPNAEVESTFPIADETGNNIVETLSSDSEETHVDTTPEETPAESYSGGPWAIIRHTGYFTVTVWALLSATVTGVAAYFFTPGDYTWIALGILGFMTGVIAAVDRKTHLIKDQHTILTAILTVPLSFMVAFNLGAWNFLFGFIAALVVFGVFIFLIIKVNFGSGGDIKFSPVPAFALGVINPLISALWLFYALILTVVLLVVRKQQRTSFGEGMAMSLPLAIASVYALYAVAGLPYMEPTSL